jgi:hypothetical protein
MGLLATAPLLRLSLPAELPPFRFTARDKDILAALACYLYASSDLIARHIGASQRAARFRLHRLYCHQLVARPRNQHAYLSAGNANLVYALTSKGARLLAEQGVVVGHLYWALKNAHRVSPVHLAHTIETAEAMLSFELASRAEGAPRLIDHHALLPFFPEPTRALRDPFRLSVTIAYDLKPLTLVVRPDRLFSLAYPDNTRHNFCLELDRGSETIRSRSKALSRNSIRKKLVAYYECWKQKRHTEVWGFAGYRVLFITPSETRLEHMIELQRQVTNDRAGGLFLYSTPRRLALNGPLGPAWVSARGDGISLVPVATDTIQQAKE